MSFRFPAPSCRSLAVLALGLAACGRPTPEPARASVASLEALLRSSTVEANGSVEVPGATGVEVLRLADGIARLRVTLTGDAASVAQREERDLVTWTLPFPADLGRRTSYPDAQVTLADGTSLWLGRTPISEMTGDAALFRRAFLSDGSLTVSLPPGSFRPFDFELTYPAVAARVAIAGLLDGESARDVLLRTVHEPGRSWRQLEIPVGLRVRVPELPAGVLAGFMVEDSMKPMSWDHKPDATPSALLPVATETTTTWPGPLEPIVIFPGSQEYIDPVAEDLVIVEPWVQDVAAEGRDATPNVLVLLLDTLRADRVGPWRDGESLTPRLDALLEESVVWERAWSTAPWTLPSIATLLTGRHAAGHGAYHQTAQLAPDVPTLGEIFGAVGYRTGAFTDGGYFHVAFGMERGFSHFDYGSKGLVDSTPLFNHWVDRSPTDPFFAVVHTYDVHEPYRPGGPEQKAILQRLPRDQWTLAAMPRELADARARGDVPEGPIDPLLIETMEQLYDLEVRALDRRIGDLLDGLESRGLLEDMVIAVVADHGEEFGEHGLAGHSDTLFPEQLHVPLAIRLPGGRDARRVSDPVSTLDFAPTLLQAAGLAQPIWDEAVSLLGASAPSPTFAWRQPHADRGSMSALREDGRLYTDGAFRFDRDLEPNGLYDLEVDPDALVNLLETDERTDEQRAFWGSRLAAMVARFGEPGPIEEGELDAETAAQLEALGYR